MSLALSSPALPPIVAIFADEDVAHDAIRALGARLVTSPAPGVMVLSPGSGLRERLYAAGAALVVA